ncbi:MAG TPA: hypothetical protein VK901_12100, partial [Nitrospiraceae bacterium]|nr:hypothetical protein [Nitrospiraceae bacterium]
MILTSREEPNHPEYLRKTLSLLASICIHAAVIGCAFWLSSLPDGAWNYRQTRQVVRIEPSLKEHKVIWLRRNERLPRISPTVRKDGAGTKTQASDKLFVLANPPKAKHWDQFVYVPVPK